MLVAVGTVIRISLDYRYRMPAAVPVVYVVDTLHERLLNAQQDFRYSGQRATSFRPYFLYGGLKFMLLTSMPVAFLRQSPQNLAVAISLVIQKILIHCCEYKAYKRFKISV
jgi:hypothetical protein